mmetsp:Transcript_31638/g.96817  ORF Transcript_31638/g.96817 Transcript_31638/m.96817 type:complete len:81 (+) Transcript_31638:466-708(+)|eukprot:scaffold6928_cov36-Tisochrysis_lutea.AAC.4
MIHFTYLRSGQVVCSFVLEALRTQKVAATKVLEECWVAVKRRIIRKVDAKSRGTSCCARKMRASATRTTILVSLCNLKSP